MQHPLAGKKQTAEHVAKRAAALRGRKGHPSSDRQKQAVRKANKGSRKSPQTIERMRKARRSREDYRGSIPQDLLERDRFRKVTQKRVFERDDYTCQICFRRGNDLHADHIKSWKDYPELRFDINNCRTLCRPCHYYVTFKRSMPESSRWGLSWVYARSEKIR